MGLAAGLTGLLPGYTQIGIWAPILLLVLRLLQGFSTGAEFGGAVTYIRECAPHTGAPSTSPSLPLPAMREALAAGVTALVASLISSDVMLTWGWLIPFLLTIPLGMIVLVLRLRIEDSPEFVAHHSDQNAGRGPVRELFRIHRGALGKGILIAIVQNVGTYIGTVFVAIYLSTQLGFSEASSTIVLIAVLFAALLIVASGQPGTRIGGKRLLMWSYAAYIVLVPPSFLLMNQGSISLAVLGVALSMTPYALCQASTHATVAEFFPVRVRHTGVAFAYSVGAVIGGGGGPTLPPGSSTQLATPTSRPFCW